MNKIRIPLASLAALSAVIVPATASAAPREAYVKYPTTVKSGPAACNYAGTLQVGPASAKNVLVLIPGYLGGSGDFRVLGRRLSAKLPNTQIWGVDRRSQCLEDTSIFETGTPAQDLSYYFFNYRIGSKKFAAPAIGSPGVEAARGWGLPTTLSDINDVITAAHAVADPKGGKVVLGGHSLGGSLTDLYAVSDFGGTPGYQRVKGLVLIDGGARGTFVSAPEESKTTADIAANATGTPFSSLFPGIASHYQGIFVSLSAKYALAFPTGASALQGLLNNVGLSAFTRKTTAGKLTNDAGLGFAFDADTSPAAAALLRFNMGGLKTPKPASPNTPQGWKDGGLTDLKDVKTMFGTDVPRGNFVEWYFPKRLGIDVAAANGLTQTAFTDSLVDQSGSGIKLRHWANVNVPLYAFETNLTCTGSFTNSSSKCGVLSGANSFKNGSKIATANFVEAKDHAQYHLDPLVARPATDKFTQTLVPFLKNKVGIN